VYIAETLRRGSRVADVFDFAVQAFIAVSIEIGDDLGRGLMSQHGTIQGIDNARHLASFEAAHDLWIEPIWQLYFEHLHHILFVTVTWAETLRVMNGIYVLCHLLVTLGVAAWVFFRRRYAFGLLRNTMILTNLFALFVYESFPVAPPRLTTGLMYHHHPFQFQDTLYGVLQGGKILGTGVGYNEFSAMPSVHIAWALLASGAIIWLARSPVMKAAGALYPGIMLLAVVVTANHYLLDAAGAAAVVVVALGIAMALNRVWNASWIPQRPMRAGVPTT
jgi:hypothetical protein